MMGSTPNSSAIAAIVVSWDALPLAICQPGDHQELGGDPARWLARGHGTGILPVATGILAGE